MSLVYRQVDLVIINENLTNMIWVLVFLYCVSCSGKKMLVRIPLVLQNALLGIRCKRLFF